LINSPRDVSTVCRNTRVFFSLDEEREHFRRDTERQALFQLDKARTKPVVFAVKTNVAFDGSLDDDSPVHGSAVSFGIGDYLHVMERYDPNWWIGRKVGPVFYTVVDGRSVTVKE
jgi:voltage-dependent calcium channel beta-2